MLPRMGKHLDKRGQDCLHHFTQHFDKLNTCILNKNQRCLVDIFGNYVGISEELTPFFATDAAYEKAVRSDLKGFHQELCRQNDPNVTVQSINALLKELANKMYNVS